MSVIDFHTHIFPDDLAPRAVAAVSGNGSQVIPAANGKRQGLLASMCQNGIDTAVVLGVATRPGQVKSINDFVLSLTEPRFIPFGAMHPAYDEFEKELGRLKACGIRGVKFHPEYQDFYIDDPRYYPLYETCAGLGLILSFHAGKDPGPFTGDHGLPRAFKKIVNDIPGIRIVAAHLGGMQLWDEVEEVLAGLPLYFDTATVHTVIDPVQFVRICEKHGFEKIIFGSDSPWFGQEAARRFIEKLPISDDCKEKILCTNAQRLLGVGFQ